LKAFLDFFSAHDTEKNGTIKAEHLYEVASMMGKDAQHGKQSLEKRITKFLDS